jgi:hypothetical protein
METAVGRRIHIAALDTLYLASHHRELIRSDYASTDWAYQIPRLFHRNLTLAQVSSAAIADI